MKSTGEENCGGSRVIRQIPQEDMPTDAELLRHLRVSFEERGRVMDSLLTARELDLATVAALIDRSPNPDALSELRGIILEAVELVKGLRREMEVNHGER